jgi:hypothetical protein
MHSLLELAVRPAAALPLIATPPRFSLTLTHTPAEQPGQLLSATTHIIDHFVSIYRTAE